MGRLADLLHDLGRALGATVPPTSPRAAASTGDDGDELRRALEAADAVDPGGVPRPANVRALRVASEGDPTLLRTDREVLANLIAHGRTMVHTTPARSSGATPEEARFLVALERAEEHLRFVRRWGG